MRLVEGACARHQRHLVGAINTVFVKKGIPFSEPRSVAHSPDDRTSSDVDDPVCRKSAIDRMMRASTSVMSHRVGPLEEVPHRLMREGLPLRMQRATAGAIITRWEWA